MAKLPVEMTVEEFIEAFRQRFGAQFVGRPGRHLVNALRESMNAAENDGLIRITDRGDFLQNPPTV